MHPVEQYLADMAETRATGGATDETSYYSHLQALLNEVGKDLKPRVRCHSQVRNQGAGSPDFGLYTSNQIPKKAEAPDIHTLPERGVIECKGPSEPAVLDSIEGGEQVRKYVAKYGQLLLTDYREFRVILRGENGLAKGGETFSIAPNAKAFWQKTAHPHKTNGEISETFVEFLKRALLSNAPLTEPEDLAWFLASYAREAKSRIHRSDMPGLASIRKALEDALGLKFEGEKGDQFFRSSLVQTIFYGVFSAWVLWHKQQGLATKKKFQWKEAQWSLHVPMIRALFHQIVSPDHVHSLHMEELLDWTEAALNRVDRKAFFQKFEEEYAVQYFYEPFLQKFDPALRKQLGVWYTPPEIVKYMVARVDTVLREELKVEGGLANPSVYVLDPCCGTGAYLVEVLRTIHETKKQSGGDGLLASDIKHAARNRVFGFEILPAPFVISHLQVGVLLQNLGAPLADDERAGVYLTNALTGWDPPKDPKDQLAFAWAELKEEKEAADDVKREKPILVILGNPPYNAFAGVSPAEEKGLVEPYKKGLIADWGIKKFNLDDLYVRFFRLAERRIAEKSHPGRGIVCYISNFSYLSDASFVVLRKRFLDGFRSLWFDCLNGDSRETGKLTPEGEPDPSVFSTEHNPAGIRLGTAIALLVRQGEAVPQPTVHFRQFWGSRKREELLETLQAEHLDSPYATVQSTVENRYSFRPEAVAKDYSSWPRVVELCAKPPSNGLMEKRGGALISIDRDALVVRMKAYFDADVEWDDYRKLGYGLTEPQARFEPKNARTKALKAEKFSDGRIMRYALRPFDVRWCYYTGVRPIWNEPRPSLFSQRWDGNTFFMTRPAGVASPEGFPLFYTSLLGDNDFLRGHAYYVPIEIRDPVIQSNQIALNISEQQQDAAVRNVSPQVSKYLDAIGGNAQSIWLHALAIGYSPAYLTENGDGVRQDWPRIPLPNSKDLLLSCAELGREIAALLDTESPLPAVDVNAGTARPELKAIAVIATKDGSPLDPDSSDLDVTAGWGHAGKDGAVMPGKGMVIQRPYAPDELKTLTDATKNLGLTVEQILELLGGQTCDVHLNGNTYWRNVPLNVWEFYIGGYQVIKKWLSYREKKLLGRGLKSEEVREVTNMARRLAAIRLLQPRLNANYAAVKGDTYSWPAVASGG